MLKYAKHAIVVLLFFALQGCKIQISVPPGGTVVSSSGKYTCRAGESCRVDVSSFSFSDSFTAVPAPGYEFGGWARGYGYFCQGALTPCNIVPGLVEGLKDSTNPDQQNLYAVVRDSLADPGAVFYLVPIFRSTASTAGTATLSWTVPTTRVNGAALMPAELSGYEIYMTAERSGISSVIRVAGGLTVQHVVRDLLPDSYHFAISSIDSNGRPSALSPVASKTIN